MNPVGQRPNSFTLVELLVAIAIATILIGLSVPAFVKISQSSILTTTTNQVIDQLNFARQEASTLNQEVEVRFYSLPAPNNSAANIYRGMQSFSLNLSSSPATTNALTMAIYFPTPVQLASSTTFSSLLDNTQVGTYSGTGTSARFALPSVGFNYSYTGFRYKADGSTTFTSPLCVTLHLVNSPPVGNTLPKNWATVQIDPLSGRVQTFRP